MTHLPFRRMLAASAILAAPAVTLAAGPPPASVWDGAYTQAQADRGQTQYAAHCVSCHGDALNGGDSAPPLSGGGFTANWNGQTAGDLFTRIKSTMPLDAPGSLGAPTVSDVEAYILSKNGFPAGQAELAKDPALLARIAISQDRPGH